MAGANPGWPDRCGRLIVICILPAIWNRQKEWKIEFGRPEPSAGLRGTNLGRSLCDPLAAWPVRVAKWAPPRAKGIDLIKSVVKLFSLLFDFKPQPTDPAAAADTHPSEPIGFQSGR